MSTALKLSFVAMGPSLCFYYIGAVSALAQQPLPLPSSVLCVRGALQAAAFAFALYTFTSKMSATVAMSDLPDGYTVSWSAGSMCITTHQPPL